MMEYEVVKLNEKKVVGIEARTNNGSPEMGAVIGGLWGRFYGAGIYENIQNKSNGKALGIYTDYEADETADYTIMTACEVEPEQSGELPEGAVERVIPGGTYAKFVVKGDLHQAVAQFWQELWQMELDRAFVCDFEEYQNGDMENAVIHVYIGLVEKGGAE